MSEKAWAGTTYGSARLHRWLIAVLKVMNVRLLYIASSFFVVPVCLVINSSRGIAYRYFRQRQGFGRLKSAWKTYVNHCRFGQVVIDRFAMYAGKKFKVKIEGYEHFERLAKGESAFVQLSSHIGNYELAGYTLVSQEKPFNALVFYGEKDTVMNNRNKMFSQTHIKMIPVKDDMSHIFEMNRVLREGEILSIPADRFVGSDRALELPLLGAVARFPAGPFTVSASSGVDVLTVHVVKSWIKPYKIYVTPLPYDKDAPRATQLQQLTSGYVAELERILKLYPTQWYNYFEFWKS